MRKVLCDSVWIGILLLFSTLHCVTPVSSGGSSSETVIGRVVNSDGSPACSTIVTLYPADYDPIRDANQRQLISDTTDANGVYSIDVRDSTVNYSIIAKTQKSGVLALIANINLKGDTTRMQDAILSRPGAILIPVNSSLYLTKGYIYVPGTSISVVLSGKSANVVLDSVPAGSSLSIHFRAIDSAATTRVIRDSLYVSSNDTLNISYTEWKFFQKLYLNTSPSGADISGDIYNFPILVRLASNNFDFSRAKSAGEDIRFTKSDGTPLPFEIERWDVASQAAEIWVKIDTIYGNDSSHYLKVYWGNQYTAASSGSESVFDTADGFIGVWHLAEAGNDAARDATHHHYDGTPADSAPQATVGIIGKALQFDGKSNGLVMKNTANSSLNFTRPGSYTFSAWVSVDSVHDGDEFIAGKGFDQYALRIKGRQSIPASMFALHEFVNAPVNGTEMRYEPVVMRQWKYMVGVRDTIGSYLFIDGRCIDSVGMTITGGVNSADTTNFSIGRCGAAFRPDDYLPFRGKVDEVRIASVRFSADWIRLSYMNQKSDDRLIRFDK